MHRGRKAKIIATIRTGTAQKRFIRSLHRAGVDVFRINFSHGAPEDHERAVRFIREVESEVGRPIGILTDLQGPKIRFGQIAAHSMRVSRGDRVVLGPGEEPRGEGHLHFPHPEVIEALQPGTSLLVDDGKVRLEVRGRSGQGVEAEVMVGGEISNHKGVNVPNTFLPLSALTTKDRRDLDFALDVGVDWIALSFVQRADDMRELRELVGERAGLMAKLEKPAAMKELDEIVRASDAVMVARGDLGVEMEPWCVPPVQKRIIRACRDAGKPVVVATQMLESMIRSPVPTRAEVSDVATAVYDGADAVMLSAETAIGDYPEESVRMMDHIVKEVECDPAYHEGLERQHLPPEPNVADAICFALQSVAHTLSVPAVVTYTDSGFSAVRASRERPNAPILALTPIRATARRLAPVWGVHPVVISPVQGVEDMVARACEVARREGVARNGDPIVIVAGQPFGTRGTTNMLRVARVRVPRKGRGGRKGAVSTEPA